VHFGPLHAVVRAGLHKTDRARSINPTLAGCASARQIGRRRAWQGSRTRSDEGPAEATELSHFRAAMVNVGAARRSLLRHFKARSDEAILRPAYAERWIASLRSR